MVQEENDTKVKVVPKLRKEFSDSLSLLDFARVVELIKHIINWEGDMVKTHMHVGENGQEIPDNVEKAENAVRKLGGFGELDYLSASMPGRFMLNADFRNNKIVVRSSDSNMLSRIEDEWNHSKGHISDSLDLASLSISSDARRFILGCINKDGTISESSEKLLPISKSYILIGLKDLGLIKVQILVASKIAEIQNIDGGWSDTPKGKSDLVSTASAILTLSSLSGDESTLKIRSSVSDGLAFLNKDMNVESMADSAHRAEFPLLLSVLSLVATGKIESDAPLVLAARNAIEDISDKLNPVLISLSIKHHLMNEQFVRKLRNNLVHEGFATEKYSSMNSFATSMSLIAIRHDPIGGINNTNACSILEYLMKTRNNDGGWPENKRGLSSLTTTINVLVALDQFYNSIRTKT
jgi:hypothetical protein